MTRDTPRSQMHWWQDWKWIASIAFLIAAIAVGSWALSSVQTQRTVDDQTPILNQLKNIAEQNNQLGQDNKATLTQLTKNQAGIDELVTFVHEVEAQQQAQGQSKVVNDIITILCSSSDPVRQQACTQLGYKGTGG